MTSAPSQKHPQSRPAMEQLLVLSAVASNRQRTVRQLTGAVLECGGNIVESHIATLASEIAVVMLISGNWHTLARLEKELANLGDSEPITVQFRRTQRRAPGNDRLPYSVDVVGLDQPGIVHNLAGFFTSRQIEIAECDTRSYAAAHTGAAMVSVQMTINVPAHLHIAGLRDEFMDFCDQANLDAILEPVKG